ncbi:MAG: hypothetical protein M1828_004450 [Chrysothrix sp. TS-e1954]|nr:MAG: hypothetical protein M1828_004450 [Chrysothrix sp. TS-e1954]
MAGVPNAWDEDYEAVADVSTQQTRARAPTTPTTPAGKSTRAQRKAQHQEKNKAIWDSAENPETLHFIDARNNVPLKTEFKPQLKVLSRKPQAPAPVPQKPAASLENGMNGVNLEDDDPDSEEEERRRQERSLGERQAKAKQEREEKQKKYQEVRERLFGTGDAAQDSNTRNGSPSKNAGTARNKNAKGHSRGGGGAGGSSSHHNSSTDQSPVRPASQGQKQLYDPNYSVKPTSAFIQSRASASGTPRPETTAETQTFRNPRGPDGSGRGGFGFASRGGKLNTG